MSAKVETHNTAIALREALELPEGYEITVCEERDFLHLSGSYLSMTIPGEACMVIGPYEIVRRVQPHLAELLRLAEEASELMIEAMTDWSGPGSSVPSEHSRKYLSWSSIPQGDLTGL